MYDVIIAGGGIAGLSAALILGRCRRSILLCDSGKPRNRVSQALHGFISRDGVNPLEMRRMASEELKGYPSVTCINVEIIDAEEIQEGYQVKLETGEVHQSKFLLIATGVVDRLPDIVGIEEFYGHNLFHCPYCDGWENRDQPIAVYGSQPEDCEFALELTCWSKDIVLCLDAGPSPAPLHLEHLARHGIGIIPNKIAGISGKKGERIDIKFNDGTLLARRVMFFNPAQQQASPLAHKLGCDVTESGVKTGKMQRTKSRLFVAGDAARSIQLAIIAAAEGAEAAFALNTALQQEDIFGQG